MFFALAILIYTPYFVSKAFFVHRMNQQQVKEVRLWAATTADASTTTGLLSLSSSFCSLKVALLTAVAADADAITNR